MLRRAAEPSEAEVDRSTSVLEFELVVAEADLVAVVDVVVAP